MQPAASQRSPAPSVLSVGSRGIAVGGEPFARRRRRRCRCDGSASRPSAPRTATAWPSAATSTSGSGVRIAHRLASTISAAPHQRSGVLQQAQHDQAGGAEQQRPDAEGRHAPDRARQARDPQRDRDHPVDAVAHQPPEQAVEAERHGDQRRAGPSASPRPTRSAWPAGWRARRRARAGGSGRRRKAWSRAPRPARPGSGPTISRPPHSATRAPSEVSAPAPSTAGRARRRRPAPASRQTTSGSSDAPPPAARAAARRRPRPRACAASAPARSTITPISTIAVMMKARWVATSAPDSTR